MLNKNGFSFLSLQHKNNKMKKISLLMLGLTFLQLSITAQKIIGVKWSNPILGGKKGYFTKMHTINKDNMIENQTGSGGQFDNSPVNIPVVEIFSIGTEERVITSYGDSSYAIIVFKNITTKNADVCFHGETFKTIEEAKAFIPTEQDFFKWYTDAGYKQEMSKPAMPEMTKKDALAFANYINKVMMDIKSKMEAMPKEGNGYGYVNFGSTSKIC
jgi:hypothetical protein